MSKRLIVLILTLTLLLAFSSVIAAPVPYPQATTANIPLRDDCATNSFAPSVIQCSEGAYVANSNTGKFHYAGCRYVARMSDSHKVYYDSREDAADAGYVPCKICRP